MSTPPIVGSVMRLRIFRRVLLPAPLLPIIPSTSPALTSNETSLSAQNVSEVDLPFPRSEEFQSPLQYCWASTSPPHAPVRHSDRTFGAEFFGQGVELHCKITRELPDF